jgi:N6-adenosine-specific RNA methylase IME4
MTTLQALGPFNLVYADPPWSYYTGIDNGSNPKNHYPTLTTEKIAALKPNVTKNAVLLLWATGPKIIEALAVIAAWGFVYKTMMVWNKVRLGLGWWVRGVHELLLIATKGQPGAPTPKNRPPSIFTELRRRHSQKPDGMYDLIDRWLPHLTDRLEMFARNTRPGWVSWGNEVPITPTT